MPVHGHHMVNIKAMTIEYIFVNYVPTEVGSKYKLIDNGPSVLAFVDGDKWSTDYTLTKGNARNESRPVLNENAEWHSTVFGGSPLLFKKTAEELKAEGLEPD